MIMPNNNMYRNDNSREMKEKTVVLHHSHPHIILIKLETENEINIELGNLLKQS